jgi:Domain of unknown function (DUF4055)
MPVDSTHPAYKSKILRWEKNRDAFSGEDAVKPKGSRYLVAPGGFTSVDYDRYRQRAKWFGATARTVAALTGAVFQKDPDVLASVAVEQHLEDITMTGIPANTLANVVLFNNELIGRYGVLQDYNKDLRRPYWSGYPAEAIRNWATRVINGKTVLSLVVLEEIEQYIDDFEIKDRVTYRELRLNDDNLYEVNIYERSTDGTRFVRRESSMPDRRLKALDFIPFKFFGSEDLTPNIARSRMDDLVDINYSYYRHSADYEHGLFLTGVPTPIITGHQLEEGEVLPIGSLAAWVIPNSEAKAYLLEYQGHGLESHERAMDNDKAEMATLGSRLLEDTPDTQETLGAVQLRHSGEQGSLKSMANLVSEGLTDLLQWHHWWHGDTDNVNDEKYQFTLNTDFSTVNLSPQEMLALMTLYQNGSMSRNTFLWNMKQGERLPPNRTIEQEEALIDIEPPARLPFGNMPLEPTPPAQNNADQNAA